MAKLDIVSIEDKTKELLENLDESGFFYDFLGLYDFPKATLTRLRKNNGNEVKNKALFEVIGQGQSVVAKVAEMEKALSSKKSKPRILIATDFEELAAKDIQTADTLNISLKDLPAYIDFFLPWNGVEKVDYAKENPADIKAAARFTRLYDELRQINQFSDQTTEEKEFNLFLIRLLFLLFAEDTEIMPKGIFTNAIKTRSAEDGSDLDNLINKIFASLDVANRSSQEKWLQEFPYVNGKLFTKAHTALVFDRKTRKLIIEAGELLNWNEINPDILGAMIQTVASKEQRSVSGMHYTSVENIMKVIKPLFLDDLTASYQNLVDKINENEDKDITDKTRRENRNTFIRELESLLDRISNIKFLDPACGSGNFLIITYKEIRRLEVKILKSLRELRQDRTIDFFETSKISLNQFYGIELDDFAHEVARLSLWIAEYQMNLEALNEINLQSAFLPLRDAGNITQGNALRLDWNEILPHQSGDEIYLIGNPPYIGHSIQNAEQKEDLKITIGEPFHYKKMDYIAGWFFKGEKFINSTNAKLAFVTTNSICQGVQVGYIWNYLLTKVSIDFAYTSFKWGNSAANNAGVTVAIIALANFKNANSEKYIFDEHLKKIKTNFINAYLAAGENLIVDVASSPLNGLPKMVFGNKPSDGGHLNFTNKEEITNVLIEFPELQPYIKKYIGSQEYINGKPRMVLWLNKEEYRTLKHIPFVSGRVESVRESRLASKAEITRKAADKPYEFLQKGEYDEAYAAFKASGQDEFLQLVVPAVSSESREYVPLGFVGEDTIVSNRCYVVYNSPIWLLGLLQSKLHMVWLAAIGGKLETRYSYSSGVVYNTFPVPELSTRRKNMIEEQVFEILDLREELGGTLAELYHKDTMPESLREAHKKLDEIVERAYKDTPFNSDEERLSHLLKRYKEMTHE